MKGQQDGTSGASVAYYSIDQRSKVSVGCLLIIFRSLFRILIFGLRPLKRRLHRGLVRQKCLERHLGSGRLWAWPAAAAMKGGALGGLLGRVFFFFLCHRPRPTGVVLALFSCEKCL